MSTELLVQDNGVILRAELDTQITTAKAYPRNVAQCIQEATSLALMDQETAQSCFYVLPRKDKEGNKIEIKGPSIRLAEIIASSWGNLHAATRIVENDGKTITTEGVCWDLEKNVRFVMADKVSIIFGQKGGKGGYQANADMQVMLSKASSSKALRNAIFKVIPKSIVNGIYEKAIKFSIGDVKTLASQVKLVIDKLVKMGVNQEELFNYFGHTRIDEFTPEDYSSMLGIGTALKEKMIKPEEVFSVERTPENDTSPNDRLEQLIATKEKPVVEEAVNGQTGEVNYNA